MRYSTGVGIDTHSKKNAVCAIAQETGEIRGTTLSEDPAQLIAWIGENDFPGPVGCVYESGPTGFGLARGRLAKQGKSHLRRILVEAASDCSKPFKAARSEDAAVPEAVRAKAGKCANRLGERRRALEERGVNANKAKAAVARGLCEWICHIAAMPA